MEIMNRIYHAKVTFCRGLVLVALTVMTLVALWWRWPLAALPAMLLLLWWIERLIHTTYTLTTDQKLLIDEGHFACRCTICLADVRHIQRSRPLLTACSSLFGGIEVTLSDGKHITLFPQREEEFMRQIEHRCTLLSKQQPLDTNINHKDDESY